MGTSKGGPAGSLQPLAENTGKWTDNIGGVELAQLAALATDINKTVDTTIKQVARGKVRVGKMLLEARSLLKEDAAFGQWRVQNTSVQSKQHAHYLMQVADRFGNATVLIEGANYSIMQELILADQKDIEWITDKIDTGEPLPTVTAVRAKVKETQAERLKGTSKKGQLKTPSEPYVPNASINSIVKESLTLRIKHVLERGIKGLEGDLIILGMDPDPQVPCNPEVLWAIAAYWDREDGARLSEEEDAIIGRSMERVEEAFRNW